VCIGVAQVLELTDELPLVTAERVLFRTTPENPVLTSAQAQHLVQSGVRLVGVDALSVDAVGGTEFPVHHVLLGVGMWIVEGLDLSAVVPGEYDLICLPLRIRGADGAPARALLRKR
jgi:arylformamidase